ncbi:MAG: DUF1501 domain-containing protein [Steroidobacteraceae bacterium]|jgi:uncharacterized protein (DUF1501 family)|nr:DUF1501 domain-containing protein [Steroidobacteraceae bacterium]
MSPVRLDRRQVLGAGIGGLLATLAAPRLATAAAATPGEARLVLVQLRGALDGLAAVPPVGDPDLARVRGALALAPPGTPGGAFALDSLFALHPALAFCAARWGAGELLAAHALATPYRERSHFDGQAVLENGGDAPSGSASGWLNRVLQALPEAGLRGGGAGDAPAQASGAPLGLALGQNVPQVLRGPVPVATWAPSRLPEVDADLLSRLQDLYADDGALSARLAQATGAGALVGEAGAAGSGERLRGIAATAGRMLAAEDGPRIAVIDSSGWDTHAGEGAARGLLALRLRGLDQALEALHGGLGAAWSRSVVVVVTEFGRTVAPNGTRGTDHGTGTVALLLGGAVHGGRVLADWPGLRPAQLHEGRDLRPTASLHGLLKGVLRDHLGLGRRALDEVFPRSLAARPVDALVRGG